MSTTSPVNNAHPSPVSDMTQPSPDDEDPQSTSLFKYPEIKKEMNVLLVGDSMKEKSDFISLLLNMSRGNGPFQMTDTLDPNSVPATVAQDPIATIHDIPFSHCTIKIVNAPGFLDHKGGIQGAQAQDSIIKAIKSVQSLDAVLIMINGAIQQPTPAIEFMLLSLAIILPLVICNNVGLVYTGCDMDDRELDKENLPRIFQQSREWEFQNPLQLALSYHKKSGALTKGKQSRQKQKLEGAYAAAVESLDEMLGWMDQRVAQPTDGVVKMHTMVLEIESQFKAIINASKDYTKLRQRLVDIRRDRNDTRRDRNEVPKSKLIEDAREDLGRIEDLISSGRTKALSLVESIERSSLGVEFGTLLQSGLQTLQLHRSHMRSGAFTEQDRAAIDSKCDHLEKSLTILQNRPDSTCAVPGLNPTKRQVKIALRPLTHKKKLTILLVGETGCGKTAFMSLLLNLFQGYGPFELEDENNKDVESGLKKQQSQTNEATLYTVPTPDGTEIQILDTPGLADTRGIGQDDEHKAKINRAIQAHVGTIDAVLIMANGTTERMPAATNYTLSILTSLFPHSIIDNIGFIFTHCDSFTQNLDMGSLPDALTRAKHWTLENPLAYHKNYRREKEAGRDPAVLREGRARLENIYQKTVLTLNQWLEWADGRLPQPTHEINRLYQTMVDIEAQIEAAISLMTRLSERRLAVQGAQHNLDDNNKARTHFASPAIID
ncbi:unnamed protein product [Rhizoctonia solani]|uniref:AAA+ ATPase domain-containing protein n=1 Tax=Rhizoctonia solani TaxID=456999 RepID=A0A8H3HUF7_9AGAM|nr:unnamed protein product [Rhizoctonia solani]